MLLWSRVLLHAWHRVRDGTGTRADLRSVATNVRAIMERLLEEGAALPAKGFQGACRNILEHRDALWRFVHDSNVEPTQSRRARAPRSRLLASVQRRVAERARQPVCREPHLGDSHLPQAAPRRPRLSQLRHSRRSTRSQAPVSDRRAVVRPVNAYLSQATSRISYIHLFLLKVDRDTSRHLPFR
jgi:hypothetical protein